jgi:hypothetical protein
MIRPENNDEGKSSSQDASVPVYSSLSTVQWLGLACRKVGIVPNVSPHLDNCTYFLAMHRFAKDPASGV